MCDPGSAECRTRDILAATRDDAEQLRANALAALDRRPPTFPADLDIEPRPGGPVYIEGGDLKTDGGQLRLIPVSLLDLLLDDVRREQAHAISEWRRTAPPGDIGDRVAENWRRYRPGFARLLDLTDRT